MKIAILGHGVEGKSVERYFKPHHEITIFDHLTLADLKNFDKTPYDLVFRSPSLRPLDPTWTSITKYFFENCPAKIIGVTGTKGKGTTCSLITAILRALGKTVHLVGNIGVPALDVLNQIKPTDLVVYELSSFQLWDLDRSPTVAVILRLEPDHLDVHADYTEYLAAKQNIAAHQTPTDTCIFFASSPDAARLAACSPGQIIPYPGPVFPELRAALDQLTILGQHNRENATAALTAVAALLKTDLPHLLSDHHTAIAAALHDFTTLPHHIEFIRTLNSVDYYDDNYCTAYPALDVALKTFSDHPLVLIAGGKDKGIDLTAIKRAIFDHPTLIKAILIGEIAADLAANEASSKFCHADSLATAVAAAKHYAESAATPNPSSPAARPVVLMSPAAASLDMFKSYSDRGQQFQSLVQNLH